MAYHIPYELKEYISANFKQAEETATITGDITELAGAHGQMQVLYDIATSIHYMRDEAGYFSDRLRDIDERLELMRLEQVQPPDDDEVLKQAQDLLVKGRNVPSRSFIQEMINCGKKGCKKCAEGARGHGPYWYQITYKGGGQHKTYIGRELPANFRAGIDHAASYKPAGEDDEIPF